MSDTSENQSNTHASKYYPKPVFSEIIELDPDLIKSIGIAGYEDKVSLSSFQFELGISSLRANVLLGQLIENKIISKTNSDLIGDTYKSNLSIKYFNEWYACFSAKHKKPNLPKAQQKIKTFDSHIEKTLLRQLKYAPNAIDRHFCYNELINFYYKYRNDYPKAVQQCFKYCIEDIESLQETNDEYFQERINGIKFLFRNHPDKLSKELETIKPKKSYFQIPAFDRITMLFFYEKDYDRAISYCRLAVEYDQDYDLKFTKRIERIKKKQAKEEKARLQIWSDQLIGPLQIKKNGATRGRSVADARVCAEIIKIALDSME